MKKPAKSSAFKFFILTALTYLMLGLAGLALAIPSGYASPIFPAAGFAVAIMLCSKRRAWPGILIGSLLLNLITGDMSDVTHSTAIIAALGICIGSTAQSYFAAWLTERETGNSWQRMERTRDIVRIFFVAGPLSCLISASVGVTTLYLNGLAPVSDLWFTVWNWWAGDTLGVLVALPLCLTWLLRNQSPWNMRPVVLGVPMLIVLAVIAAGYLAVSKWEIAEEDKALRNHAERLIKRLEQRFIAHEEALASLKRLIEVTPDMNYAQFEYFTRITLRENPDIFALSFNPYVRQQDRGKTEHAMALATQKPDFEIKERDAQRGLSRAGNRADYVVVGYIAPLEGNRSAIGYDINSEPIRQDAIRRARQSLRLSVTAPVQLVQENQKRVGALLLHPAYATTLSSGSPESDGLLMGFAVAVIKLDQMTEIATRDIRIPGLAFSITDRAAGEHGLVFQSNDGLQPKFQTKALKVPLIMADRIWELAVYPTATYLPAHRPWIAWATAVIGLLLAALLLVLLLVTTGHAAAAQRKVKKQSEELETQGAVLLDQTALISMLFELSPDGFVALAPDGIILLANPALQRMFDIPADEIIGLQIENLDKCLRLRVDKPEHFSSLETLFTGGDGNSRQLLALTKPREVVLQMIAVRSGATGFDRFIYFRDVTHETQIDLMKSEFISIAAHELRTPMASIYGFTELLLSQQFDEAERIDLLGTIFKQSELMISIINEMLDIARIDARRDNDFVFATIDVRGLLHEVIAGFKTPDGRPSPAAPQTDFPLWVRADRNKLTQAISNVLSNAYKYSPGGGEIAIDLLLPDSHSKLLGIRITDHGIGMTPEQLTHVCQRFYRADASGMIPGTGLGMSIVKEIIELHGGKLEITSKLGSGTSVLLWLQTAEMSENYKQSLSLPPADALQEKSS